MRALLLRLLRLPAEPEPPPGDRESLAVFRASRRYLAYRRFRWALQQVGAVVGLVVSLVFLRGIEQGALPGLEKLAVRLDGLAWLVARLGLDLSLVDVLSVIEGFAIAAFLVQLPVGFAMLTLSWEQRWYMVSDTSLRIRDGLWRVREQTMTLANIQNMNVRQGPLQRLLAIADLEVHTAGGGAVHAEGRDDARASDGHLGRMVGLDDADGVRDRIRAALSRHLDAGLGDPDDGMDRAPSAAAHPASGAGAETAAHRLLSESRALRAAFEGMLGRAGQSGLRSVRPGDARE